MFYNMFHNQPLTYLFSFYSKINIEIFCLYRKKAYFCIRLAEEPEPVSLTYWKRILQVNGLNKKKLPESFGSKTINSLSLQSGSQKKKVGLVCRFFLSLSQESLRVENPQPEKKTSEIFGSLK